MDILGIGPGELLLVFVMALIVFGPGKLPELGLTLGRAIREFQRASSEMTSEINRQLEEAENRRVMEQHPNPPIEASAATLEAASPVPAVVSSEAPHLEPIPSLEPAEAAWPSEMTLPEPTTLAMSDNGQVTDEHTVETPLTSTEVLAVPAPDGAVSQPEASSPVEATLVAPAEIDTSTEASHPAASAELPVVEQAPAVEAEAEQVSNVKAADSDVSADGQPIVTEIAKRQYRARQERQHVGQSSPTDG